MKILFRVFAALTIALSFTTTIAQEEDLDTTYNHPRLPLVEDDAFAPSIAELDSLIAEEDEEDEEELFSLEDSLDSWDNTKVNPYNVKLSDLKDTVVSVAGYYHPNYNVVTSEYGPRWGRFHAGTDMRVRVGDTIRAAFDGKVRITRSDKRFRKKGYGYFVMLRHANGLETLYGHLSKVLVKRDSIVRAGEPIGLGGNTGRSTGPHLHFEFRYLGNPINPRSVVDFNTGKVLNEKYSINKTNSFKEFDEYLRNPAMFHKIRKGDTLGRIARKYHTSVSKLCKLNRIKSTTPLRVGRKLRVH